MSARDLFIACGIHANNITEQAATELLAYNKAQNAGLWEHGMKRGEHVPVWTGALRTAGDIVRLQAWLEGHKAHGAKRIEIRPVNGFEWCLGNIPTVGGFALVYAAVRGKTAKAMAYARI